MPALSIAAEPPFAANDIEDAVSAAELDWLENALSEAKRFAFLPDAASMDRFHDVWLRLERLALGMGMPDGQGDGVVAWAEDYLRQHGRAVPQPAAFTIGTPEYRQRHIAMLWQANLWHEAIMVLSGAGAIGLLFYAIAQDMQSWM
ncbi:hypothetical protein ASE85_02360 [Sphingobium sp. Leaf26]|uniref:hypothetical protein n=1 Tax=Sphingobium sp. Leaf26 TaxID=1735693 RepID=UPI0006FF1A7D|nr:hypothetical protein [Sphingobium sp. Leaf26]KQN09803.1 hypothetical protein ASE85_02360 [Sphingobium sp. Leaf26]